MDFADLQPGERIAERYVVKRRIRGGPNPLYEVSGGDETLTISVLPWGIPDSAERTQELEESVAAALFAGHLGHPNIASTREAGLLDSGETYLVLDGQTGVTLGSYVGERKLAAAEIEALTTQIGAGLTKAHEAGILHRALRPDAILVEKGPPLMVKLVDFGLPEPTKEEQTPARACYESPEQFRGTEPGDEALDERTDVYALGVVLYELAAQKRPFHTPTLDDLLLAIAQEPPTPLAELRPDLGLAFATAVHAALSPQRELRPPSVSVLVEAVRTGLDLGKEPLAGIVAENEKVFADQERGGEKDQTPTPEPPARVPVALLLALVLVLGGSALAAQWLFGPKHRPLPQAPESTLAEARAVAVSARALRASPSSSAPPP